AALGDISFTADLWSSKTRYPYFAVTVHWVARKDPLNLLSLCSGLIAFHRVRGKHSGERLARIALNITDRAKVTGRMGHWTLDNASINDTFMQGLQDGLKMHNISTLFMAQDQRIMCFTHIVNICAGHMTEKASNTPHSDDLDNYRGEVVTSGGGRDVIVLCCNTVCGIRASGQRINHFEDTIKLGNEKKWFKDGDKVVRVHEVQLLHNVRTRWDSVFLIGYRFLELRLPLDHFISVTRELEHLKMTPAEWSRLEDIIFVLGVCASLSYN
ncbi:hypothetical protein H0H81_005535, partial [Sphagnurus paluster]